MQEVSGVYTSPFLHTDERKMALRARKTFRSFRETGPKAAVRTIKNTKLREPKNSYHSKQ